ncbi:MULTISPECIES: single-stranded DNA-binding protein [Enterobacteriaceae]|jgi:single-stranded DNA-binding protein|uniref:single-stranded DNA-binding protein n=1 Tax=Enterobacteriaceae TaxID=543 RepID=UPI001230142A|nr:single-stranded DNA-binding protein [Citrobacter freundii]EEK6072793.1 single-stranded DNA-binding protein [Salmonella enterica subsp. enterica serovar Newport]KAA3570820.1 single-stranded DNA-binding protein [Citrobacter freundii]MDJ7443482.1 single-stranded DNA-binding protein [Salmonella enterica]
MTAQISAYGRLVADVQSRTTNNGNTMAFTRMAVTLPCQKAENGEATFWLAVTAFGRQAQALAKHQKGDLVSVAGNMQVNQWTGNDGGTQTGYQVIADSVISARTARPSGKKGQQGQAIDALRRAQESRLAAQGYDDYDRTQLYNDDF